MIKKVKLQEGSISTISEVIAEQPKAKKPKLKPLKVKGVKTKVLKKW